MYWDMKRFFMRKLSYTERTAPLRSYGDASRRIRKLNKHPIDALILHRGGILAHPARAGVRQWRKKRSPPPRGPRLADKKDREERTAREARGNGETWQSEWTDYTAYRVLAGLNEYCRRYPGVPNSTLLPLSFEYPLSLAWKRVTDLRSSILSLSSSFQILSLLPASSDRYESPFNILICDYTVDFKEKFS